MYKTKKNSIGEHLDMYLIKRPSFREIEAPKGKTIADELGLELSPLRIITIEEARKIKSYLIPSLS